METSLSPRAFQRLFPNASRSTFAANFGEHEDPQDYAPRLPDAEPERVAPETLDGGVSGETKSAGRARVCIKRFGSRELDHDNLTAGCKPIIDCLKEAGLIIDDSPQHIALVVTQELASRWQEERTEIEITWPP